MKNSRKEVCFSVNADKDVPQGPANSWTEIYRYDSSTGQITRNGVTSIEDTTNELPTLTDPATGPRLFRRLVIGQVP